MSERKFSEEHEWMHIEGDVGTVGVTNYAQEQLGDIVFVELPDVGSTFFFTVPKSPAKWEAPSCSGDSSGTVET